MIKALIFEGGENVSQDNETELEQWDTQSALVAIKAYKGDDWEQQVAEDMFEDGPVALVDTIEVVSDNLIQAVCDAMDGGMLYIVRL